MPSPSDIVAGLQRLANDAYPYAILWHVAVGCALALLARGWRPLPRAAGLWSILPLVSVSAFAWASGNPFNGTFLVLLVGAVGLLAQDFAREHAVARRLPLAS